MEPAIPIFSLVARLHLIPIRPVVDTITLNASDSFGNSATQQTIAVTASGAPVITVPGAQTLGIRSEERRVGKEGRERGKTHGENLTATGTETEGVLSATGGVQSNSGHTLTFSWLSLADDGIRFHCVTGVQTCALPNSITLNASDSFGNSATQQTIAVTASGAPVITVPGAQTLGI